MSGNDFIKRASGIHQKIVNDVPQLKYGKVWCRTCGKMLLVNSAKCLSSGWPKCCGYTMTIDEPEEEP